MNIELKNVEVHVRLSEETPAYTARVFVDGSHFADVSNHGHGGSDMVHPPEGVSGSGFYERMEKVERSISETYPKHDMSKYDMDDMDETLEGICHRLVWDYVDRRNFKSQLSRKVMIRHEGNLYDLKGRRSQGLIDAAVREYGRKNVLNLMDFDEAWKLMK